LADAGDDDRDEDGGEDEAAAIEPVGVFRGGRPPVAEHARGDDRARVQHPARVAPVDDRAPEQQHREKRTDEQRRRPRVGPVVDA
jgi:hypothetical protein